MRGSLVGNNIDGQLTGAVTLKHLREDFGSVAHHTDGQRALFFFRLVGHLDGFVQGSGDLIEVTLALTTLQASLVHIGDDAHTAVELDGERLGATHTTATTGQGQGTSQSIVKALGGHRRESFVGALQNALGGDVNPGASGHLAVHHQAFVVELAEVLPVRPVAHQVGVRDQHAWRPFVSAQHADWFTGLHQQGLIGFEILEDVNNGVERFPVTGSFTGATVNH